MKRKIPFLSLGFLLLKRLADIALSLIGLVLLSPLALIISILIKIDSAGPVFYRQERQGKDGRIFEIWKFRTMRHNAELETGPVWASKDDPRITRIGAFLRNSHLDELPQLINVLRGEMAIVGPCAERPELAKEIKKHIPGFDMRLRVKPGITGLAQVKFRYASSVTEVARKLSVPRMVLVVNKTPQVLDREEIKKKVESTYNCPVAAVIPHSDEMMALASSGIFTLEYPDNEVSKLYHQVADILIS